MTADSCSGVWALGARGTRTGADSVLFLAVLEEVFGMILWRAECLKGKMAFCIASNGASNCQEWQRRLPSALLV